MTGRAQPGSAMHVGFLVVRRSYLKHFAGAVEEALGRGWRVTLLCDHRDGQARATGWKGYDFPRLDAMPGFVRGTPGVAAFTALEDLDALISGGGIRALFVVGARRIVIEIRRRFPTLLIAQIQSAWDALMLHVTPETLALFDAIYGFSDAWVDWWADYQVAYGRIQGDDREVWRGRLKDRYVSVGLAEAEQLKYLDRAGLRARLGLPEGRPVVLYLPFPFQSVWREFWPHRVHRPRRAVAALHVLASGRRQWWPYVRRGWNDRTLVAGLRRFCDANDAVLAVKSRMKNLVPRYLRRVADVTLYDDAYYPATILELLAVSSLCVHYYSFALSEAVYAGVPSVCISPSAVEWPKIRTQKMAVSAFSASPEGFYNFPGAVWSLSLPEAFERLPGLRLDALALDEGRRRAFISRLFGPEDLDVAARIHDDVERRLAAA
jgi:hypothetical protein